MSLEHLGEEFQRAGGFCCLKTQPHLRYFRLCTPKINITNCFGTWGNWSTQKKRVWSLTFSSGWAQTDTRQQKKGADLSIPLVRDPLDLDLFPPHLLRKSSPYGDDFLALGEGAKDPVSSRCHSRVFLKLIKKKNPKNEQRKTNIRVVPFSVHGTLLCGWFQMGRAFRSHSGTYGREEARSEKIFPEIPSLLLLLQRSPLGMRVIAVLGTAHTGHRQSLWATCHLNKTEYIP